MTPVSPVTIHLDNEYILCFSFQIGSANQQTQTLQRTPKFDLKGPVYGYRSLSNGSRAVGASSVSTVDKSSSLFAGGEDDPPLLMSSIDEVTSQVIDSVIDYSVVGS